MAPEPSIDRRPLTERFRPLALGEMVGNPGQRDRLRAWAEQWDRGTRPPRMRAALLSGPPGVGKTTAALAVAHEFGWNIVELNASDARNQTAIEQVAGRASLSYSLMAGGGRGSHGRGRPLILLDEADLLTGRITDEARRRPQPTSLREFLRTRYGSVEALNTAWKLDAAPASKRFQSWDDVPATPGRAGWARLDVAQADLRDWRGSSAVSDLSDRGGLGAIARLVKETRQPLVLTVNDDRSLLRYSPIFRSGVERIRFDRVSEEEIRSLVRRVILRDRAEVGAEALEAIVRRSRGDLRAALNDLDAIAVVPPGPQQSALLTRRDSTEELAELTAEVLSHPAFYRNVQIRDRVDATPDDLLPWIEENAPRFARTRERGAAGLDEVARAEMLLARARRFRVFGLWSFASEILTGGTSLAIAPAGERTARDAVFPVFLGEMGRSRFTRMTRQSVLSKIGRRLHISRRKAVGYPIEQLEEVFVRARDDPSSPAGGQARALAHELELTREEVAYLVDLDPSASVVGALAPAEPPSVDAPDDPPARPSSEGAPRSGRRQRKLGDF